MSAISVYLWANIVLLVLGIAGRLRSIVVGLQPRTVQTVCVDAFFDMCMAGWAIWLVARGTS